MSNANTNLQKSFILPSLKQTLKIFANNVKEVDFTQLYDSNQTKIFDQLRHKYDALYSQVSENFHILRRTTKYLKKLVEHQTQATNGFREIVQGLMTEEPLMQRNRGSVAQSAKLDNNDDDHQPILKLPSHLQNDETKITEHNNNNNDVLMTDLGGLQEIYKYDWKICNVEFQFWSRFDNEICEPLYQFRKAGVTKLETINEYVNLKQTNLMKMLTKTREIKIAAVVLWNDLCDARQLLEKTEKNHKDAKNIAKQQSKIATMAKKVEKTFEDVAQHVESANEMQDEFWNECIKTACYQLEAMEVSRVAFMQEYLKIYKDLISWKKSEEANGEITMQNILKCFMLPTEIVQLSCSDLIADHGAYNPRVPFQYEMPCSPEEVSTIQGALAQQRIDPSKFEKEEVYFPQPDNKQPIMVRRQSQRSVSSVRRSAAAQMLSTQRTNFFVDDTYKVTNRTNQINNNNKVPTSNSPTALENEEDDDEMIQHTQLLHTLDDKNTLSLSTLSSLPPRPQFDLNSTPNPNRPLKPPPKPRKSAPHNSNSMQPLSSNEMAKLQSQHKVNLQSLLDNSQNTSIDDKLISQSAASSPKSSLTSRSSGPQGQRHSDAFIAKRPKLPKKSIDEVIDNVKQQHDNNNNNNNNGPLSLAQSVSTNASSSFIHDEQSQHSFQSSIESASPSFSSMSASHKAPQLPKKSPKFVAEHVRKNTLEKVKGRPLPQKPDAPIDMSKRQWKMSMA